MTGHLESPCSRALFAVLADWLVPTCSGERFDCVSAAELPAADDWCAVSLLQLYRGVLPNRPPGFPRG